MTKHILDRAIIKGIVGEVQEQRERSNTVRVVVVMVGGGGVFLGQSVLQE